MKESVLIYESISGGDLAASDVRSSAPPGAGLLAQGTAMRDALAADLARLTDLSVACVTAPFAPLPAALDRVHAVTPPTQLAPVPFLAGEARGYDRVWVIAPECGGLLADFAAAVGAGRWVGCDLSAIALASSKAATRSLLAAHDIAVPDSWRPGEPEPTTRGAWIVKPDDGAGCSDTRRHERFPEAREDLLGRLARGETATLERWIEGAPLSLSLLCAGGRAELLGINRQRVEVRADGLLAYRGVEHGAFPVDGPDGRRLARLAQGIAAAVPGLAGYVGVDLVWSACEGASPPRPVVIEINPRLTCAYAGLSEALGRNLAGEVLRAHRAESSLHDA